MPLSVDAGDPAGAFIDVEAFADARRTVLAGAAEGEFEELDL